MQEGQTKGTANMTGSPVVLNVFKEHARTQLMEILDNVSSSAGRCVYFKKISLFRLLVLRF